MPTYPTYVFLACYPKHTYFFYLALQIWNQHNKTYNLGCTPSVSSGSIVYKGEHSMTKMTTDFNLSACICSFLFRFYNPANPKGSCQVRSVQETTFIGQA